MLIVTAALFGCAGGETPTRIDRSVEPTSTGMEGHWRLGFRVGSAYVLETPELGEVPPELMRELSEAAAALEPEFTYLRIVPMDRLGDAAESLINPERWTLISLDGTERRAGFPLAGYIDGATFTGDWHLVSEDAEGLDSPLQADTWITEEALVIGIADGPDRSRGEVRKRLLETPWEDELPLQDPEYFPPGSEEARSLLAPEDSATDRHLYGSSIEAMVGGGVEDVWLLNYGAPDLTVGSHPWGIFVSSEGRLEPIYVFRSEPASRDQAYESNYHASLVAALDLDGDGNDEFIIAAGYYEGAAFKIIALRDGAYLEISSSYYRGL